MTTEDLISTINALSPEDQISVALFLDFLKHRDVPSTRFRLAVDEFIAEHPELLQRLAQ